MNIAYDRSSRTVDADGRLHIADCNITKACVSPYSGSEIAGAAELGLDPSKTYKLYRDADALEAAAPTFENMPLMMQHVPVSAADPQKMLTVGTLSNVRWKAPYLVADLAVWDAQAIRVIESGEQRELSGAYRYVADMTPGTIDGERYDGRMLKIQANHVALVTTGRVGPDVLVADSEEFNAMRYPTAKQIAATADKKGLALALDAVLEKAEAESDEEHEFYGRTADEWQAMSAEDKKAARDEWKISRHAKDIDHRKDFDGAKDEIRAQLRAAFEAREAVRPVCGTVALDSADEIYAFALKHMKIDTRDVPAAAYRRLFEVARARKPERESIALDTAFSVASIFGRVGA